MFFNTAIAVFLIALTAIAAFFKINKYLLYVISLVVLYIIFILSSLNKVDPNFASYKTAMILGFFVLPPYLIINALIIYIAKPVLNFFKS